MRIFGLPLPLFIGLIALILLILGLIIFFIVRRSRTGYEKYSLKSTDTTDPSDASLINLFVEDQSTHIGKRNVHSLKPGYSLTVGGGNSDFLIFLVPLPSAIGEIRRDGDRRCTFIPRKPKYFPDLGSSELGDCIGKTVRVVSDKEYELRFRFEQYEDPLNTLNKVLNSLNVPS